jgi:hypothetical protein
MSKNAAKVVNVENLSAEEKERLIRALKEMSGSLTRAEAERDYVKDARKKIADELKLSPKLVGKLAKVYHKQNFDEERAAHEEFEKVYLTLTTKGQG